MSKIAKSVVNNLLSGKTLTESISLVESSVDMDDDKVRALFQFLDLDEDNEANWNRVTVESYDDNLYSVDGKEFLICTDDEADEEFEVSFMNLIDDLGLDAFSSTAREYIVENFVDEDVINEYYQDDVRSYAEDIQNEGELTTVEVENEDGDKVEIEVNNRLFKECLENDCIDLDDLTTADFDEDGDYIGDTDLVDLYCDHFQTPEDQGYDNGYQWLSFNFGNDWATKFISDNDAIDWDGVIEYVKSEYGRGNELNHWDGTENEEDVDGETYYIYPQDDYESLVGDNAKQVEDSENIDTGEE